ncbi:hypothetical protein DAEQUDRAFT_100082 [Daedalea quercina L-15889]|uniref:Uncharacterized protein n=1 Tax=Daedalea quercina L-15889 TaxID=1314783 RepID=A0A165KX06_9APHY|nr:hypothetical protein DAEQUDRAFT_100082 [Daedalea quercina L-15889]
MPLRMTTPDSKSRRSATADERTATVYRRRCTRYSILKDDIMSADDCSAYDTLYTVLSSAAAGQSATRHLDAARVMWRWAVNLFHRVAARSTDLGSVRHRPSRRRPHIHIRQQWGRIREGRHSGARSGQGHTYRYVIGCLCFRGMGLCAYYKLGFLDRHVTLPHT